MISSLADPKTSRNRLQQGGSDKEIRGASQAISFEKEVTSKV